VKSYVNLGCGNRYHPAWTNIDVNARDRNVIRHDLSKGIPLASVSCDVVYHAAVLEHIRREDVLPFMQECRRVLKPGGIIRIGVPDLERLCRLYLEKLERCLQGDIAAAHDYDWMLLEMYDQVVREVSGGEMLDYLSKTSMPNQGFVLERIGEEGRDLIQQQRKLAMTSARESPKPLSLYQRVHAAARLLAWAIIRWLAGPDAQRAIHIGRFRLCGEAHQWMYDRFSLSRLLIRSGFHAPCLRSACESAIPDWSSFCLDSLPDGTPIKPDLFFMEAYKSASA
jgi:predicted SAM-dependent methyltransferase